MRIISYKNYDDTHFLSISFQKEKKQYEKYFFSKGYFAKSSKETSDL